MTVPPFNVNVGTLLELLEHVRQVFSYILHECRIDACSPSQKVQALCWDLEVDVTIRQLGWHWGYVAQTVL